jgi:signal transduction histidine kinase
MLRRKLVLMFAPLVLSLVAVSVTAILLLEDVLVRLGNPQAHDWMTHVELAGRFRWIVLGLSVAFLVLVNAMAFVLIRAAGMILNPVDRLVAASRELAAERFEHRVTLEREDDEFGELARAYNHLAAELQANERRRVEMLGMAALALNHELNNAMGMIELQLQLLSRRAPDPARLERCLRRIGEGLSRMSGVVESLKHVKRIVLTEYVEGTKMLDLQRSTAEQAPSDDDDDTSEQAAPPSGGGRRNPA